MLILIPYKIKFCSPVDEPSSDTALEEATAAVTGVDAIVFTTAWIRTHFTKQAMAKRFTWNWTVFWREQKCT